MRRHHSASFHFGQEATASLLEVLRWRDSGANQRGSPRWRDYYHLDHWNTPSQQGHKSSQVRPNISKVKRGGQPPCRGGRGYWKNRKLEWYSIERKEETFLNDVNTQCNHYW